jgi:hypothetical protein
MKSEAAPLQKTKIPQSCISIAHSTNVKVSFMSDKTMHLQAGKMKDIKYITLIFLCRIPVFIVHENFILTNSLIAIIWVCQKHDKVDTTYIKNKQNGQYTHSHVGVGICSNWKKFKTT